MPTSFFPTVTTFNNNIVTVTSTDGTSYESIINSMGSHVYEVTGVYLKTNGQEQILEGFGVFSYDVNGKFQNYVEKPTIAPYQYQNSKFLSMKGKNVVLNGQTTFNINILPNEVIYMNVYVNELTVGDYLQGKTMFENDFFKNFSDAI